MFGLRTFTGLATVLLTYACGSSAEPASAPDGAEEASPQTAVAELCAVRPAGVLPRITAETHVYLELAEVTFDLDRPPPNPVPARFFDDPRLALVWSAHLLAKSEHAASMSWGSCSPQQAYTGPGCRTVTVTPHTDPENAREVRLDLILTAPSTPTDSPAAADRPTPMTVTLQEQQVLVLRLPAGQLLMVTPYVVTGRDELQRLFDCKQRRPLQRPGTPS